MCSPRIAARPANSADAIESQVCNGRSVIRPQYRRLAAFAVTVLVLGLVQTGAHRGAVRHVVCSEHGELVEAPELDGKLDDQVRFVAVTLGVDGDDEHCAMANGLRPYSDTTHSPTIATVASPCTVVLAPVLASRIGVIDYRIAPKTSPPIALS